MNKTHNPLVSCIIPTKDRPALLNRAIRSVLCQSYSNIEILVIDDSTTDETYQIFSKENSKLRYFKNSENRGAPYSRNVGLIEAKGDFISFLDDDDYWFPNKIETQLKHIKDIPFVSCNSISSIGRGKKLYTVRPKLVGYQELLYSNLIGSCSFPLIEANLTENIYFDENLKRCQDWDYWIAVMKKNCLRQVKTSKKYLVFYNMDDHLRISNANYLVFSNFIIYQKYINEYKDTEKLLKHLVSDACFETKSILGKLIGLIYKLNLSENAMKIIKTFIRNKVSKTKYLYL